MTANAIEWLLTVACVVALIAITWASGDYHVIFMIALWHTMIAVSRKSEST